MTLPVRVSRSGGALRSAGAELRGCRARRSDARSAPCAPGCTAGGRCWRRSCGAAEASNPSAAAEPADTSVINRPRVSTRANEGCQETRMNCHTMRDGDCRSGPRCAGAETVGGDRVPRRSMPACAACLARERQPMLACAHRRVGSRWLLGRSRALLLEALPRVSRRSVWRCWVPRWRARRRPRSSWLAHGSMVRRHLPGQAVAAARERVRLRRIAPPAVPALSPPADAGIDAASEDDRGPRPGLPRRPCVQSDFVPMTGGRGLPDVRERRSSCAWKLPLTSLPAYGIDFPIAGLPVEADMLVGQDGQARAIRLVTAPAATLRLSRSESQCPVKCVY